MEIVFEDVSFKNKIEKLNLKIEEGKIVGIIGKSGSGKSLIAEMMDVLESLNSGKIKIGEYEVLNSKIDNINEIRSNIGLVFQNLEDQLFNTTVYDEIAFGMKHFNYKIDKIDSRIKDALKMVMLKDNYLNKNPFQLSAGEMRKVAIASVLAYNPKILILDDPLSSLDYQSKQNLIKIIRNLKKRYNKTIIIMSQNADFLHKIVDYIYVLEDGKIVLEGDKYNVFKQEERLKEYNVDIPKVIQFSNMVLDKKNIKMGYRDDINDLIKDIYRYVK